MKNVHSEAKEHHKISTWKLCIFHSRYIYSCEGQIKIKDFISIFQPQLVSI